MREKGLGYMVLRKRTEVLVTRTLDEAKGRQGDRVGASLLRGHILRQGPSDL